METKLPYGSVSGPSWSSSRVFLVGGGPSLTGFDFEQLRGETVVAINDAVLHLPWASALFSLDRAWISNRQQTIRGFPGGRYLGVYESAERTIRGACYLRISYELGLSSIPWIIHSGGTSGYGALNLAFLKGAKEIILLGYDFRAARSGRQNWHEGYSWQDLNDRDELYRMWASKFGTTVEQLREAKVTVWNASQESRIEAFPKIPFEEILCPLPRSLSSESRLTTQS